jgi:hypothetical protein
VVKKEDCLRDRKGLGGYGLLLMCLISWYIHESMIDDYSWSVGRVLTGSSFKDKMDVSNNLAIPVQCGTVNLICDFSKSRSDSR